MRAHVHLLCASCLVGCVGDLEGHTGPALPERAPGPTAELGQPTMDGGSDLGGEVRFAGLQADLDRLGCAGCHVAGRPPVLIAKPPTASELDQNYAQVLVEVDTAAPESSRLLRRPLGDAQHPQLMASTTDPTYQRWLAWIRAGAPR